MINSWWKYIANKALLPLAGLAFGLMAALFFWGVV